MLGSPEEIIAYVPQEAYVMINCEDGAQEFLIEELKSIEWVKEITGTFGSYDIVTKIVTPSIETLRETISLRIRKIPEVHSTKTIICEPFHSFI